MKNINKVQNFALILASPINEDILKRIGAFDFDANFNLTILDCVDWIRENKNFDSQISSRLNIIRISTKNDFKNVFSKFHFDILFDFIGYCSFTRYIQDICSEYNILYISHSLYPVPSPIIKSNFLNSLLISPKQSILKFYKFCLRSILNQQPKAPDVSYVVGNAGINHLNSRSKNIIFTTSQSWYDIEFSKNATNSSLKLPDNFILFIDDCISQSIDFQLTNSKSIISPLKYYPLLNNFFNKLESELCLPIVVAGHPNGKEIIGYKDSFCGRPVFFDSTAFLCVKSNLVLSHYSTAINYAVLVEKPLILLNFEDLKSTYQGLILKNLSLLLKCIVLDIDRASTINFSDIALYQKFDVDRKAYQNFVREYISNEANINTIGPYDNLIKFIKNSNND
jgi:hypothetical protein